jgi:hypothetical protein
VAPHIAVSIPAESATRTAGAVTVTAITVAGNAAEAAPEVIAAKTVTAATTTITAAAGKCAGEQHRVSESKDNCKSNYTRD